MPYKKFSDHVRLSVRLTPNGGRNELDGIERNSAGDFYAKIRVSAVAEKGKANKALLEVIANRLGIAKSLVTIITGETSRQKILRIDGDAEDIVKKLDNLLKV